MHRENIISVEELVVQLEERGVEQEIVEIIRGLGRLQQQTPEGSIDWLHLRDSLSLEDNIYYDSTGGGDIIGVYGGEYYKPLNIASYYSYKEISNWRLRDASAEIVAERFLDSATGKIFNRVRVVDKGGRVSSPADRSSPIIVVADNIWLELLDNQVAYRRAELDKQMQTSKELWEWALESYSGGLMQAEKYEREGKPVAGDKHRAATLESMELRAEIYIEEQKRLAVEYHKIASRRLEIARRWS